MKIELHLKIALAVLAMAVVCTVSSVTLYVTPDSLIPSSPYTNWATADAAIQQAVDGAAPGDEIVVTNGVWCSSTRAVLTNCVMVDNSASSGGGAYYSTLYNCTVTSNSAEYGGGATGCRLYNCIACINTARNGANYAGCLFCELVLNYCCTTPLPTDGIGNIDAEPQFMNAAAGDFRLRPNSPCIEAGTNLNELISIDILGRPRNLDGNGDGIACVDMGAYEFNPYRFEPELKLNPNGLVFTVRGEPGKSVRLERSCDLLNWDLVATVPIPASGQTLIDPAALANRSCSTGRCRCRDAAAAEDEISK